MKNYFGKLTTRRDIDVRIEMGFDAMLYQGGLKSLGYLKKRDRGHEVYGIKAYKDLVPLFGGEVAHSNQE